jgi:quercetin dioxygenase-like cupin family protein
LVTRDLNVTLVEDLIAVEGEAEIQISGQKYRLREEETITMPANQPHALKAESNFKMLLVMIKA